MKRFTPVVITIAGSDSSGGAGIQADLKVINHCGGFGTTAITALTAQNISGISHVQPASPKSIYEQIKMIASALPVAAAKTGMLFSREIIRSVVRAFDHFHIPVIVVDPVMVATSGTPLLKSSAIRAVTRHLIPRAAIVTPNMHEAAILGMHIGSTINELMQATAQLATRYHVPFLLKGGHGILQGADIFSDGKKTVLINGTHIPAQNTHGTGCALSAGIAAHLAAGMKLLPAIRAAKAHVRNALAHQYRLSSTISYPSF